ncbi:integrating conjugative element protein [Rodentibacter ratti]|uniref:Lysozyme n=1 Tax=Rodentibacter ratti TaxID=1906745 RepID=A0A1V3KWD5_9PAST|nr:integrating conjugative element protein [Rodentibacter ratti]OOF81969.1 integrating conjugative element protein [Rodentibacter ratti]
MKLHHAVKASYIAISCAILSATIPASASNANDAFSFNKADSILSDKVFYQIGGGVGYMAPPSRGSIPAAEFGIGWKANLMCGNFDIKTSIKNQLNGLTEGFKDLYSNVIESATGAVASLPAMLIQRANPQLYDILTNGLYQGRIDFNNLKTSCEEMSKKLADATLNGRWSESADMESYKKITSDEPDATRAKKKLEESQGREGKEWVGGQKRGGQGQEPIKIVEDVAKAGYNMQNKRNVLDTGRVSTSNCSGLLCQTWDNPKDMTDWLTNVIGEKQITTCKTDCGTPSSSRAGVGLTQEIEQENIKAVTQLQKALNMNTPSVEVLAELSSTTVPVTRGLIESLREDPDAQVLGQRLASEIAVAKTMEKMLLARRSVLTGMREPNVANNQDAQAELEKVLTLIDREIGQIRMEIDLQKSLTGNSAVAILQNKELREYNAGTSNVARDSVDKRISDLANGINRNTAELAEADNIHIPRNNVTLEIPQTSNSFSYTRTGSTSNTSGGKYSSIPAISGSALEQATGLLKNFEGFSNKAYWDVNAYRTGYGSDTITKADGTIVRVTKDTVVTREDAERDLARRTQEFANRARNNVSSTTWNALPPNAQAALTSYAYNYGSLTKDVIAAAQVSAQSGDMQALANAVRNRQTNNNGVNAKRRNQEADYILGK